MHARMPGPLSRTDVGTAMMVKYAGSAWHALKVGISKEIGNFRKALESSAMRRPSSGIFPHT